ncbi:MAG TPA: hypothetical protein ENK62_08110, partial [Chromatiales bacterium]|nr:hypothetical protein [Chromatiales bacterium]
MARTRHLPIRTMKTQPHPTPPSSHTNPRGNLTAACTRRTVQDQPRRCPHPESAATRALYTCTQVDAPAKWQIGSRRCHDIQRRIPGSSDAATCHQERITMSHEGACIGCEVFRDQYRAAEDAIARRLAAEARLDPQRQARVQAEARALVEATRRRLARHGPFEQLLASYDLSTEEGLSLMLLAEALLRIPDAATAERLVADHLAGRDWSLPEANGPALLQLAARALNLAGGLFGAVHRPVPEPRHVVARLVARLGERPALAAVRQGMKILAGHFVAGQTLTEARAREHPGERYTYDRLGESARTSEDADRYTAAYLETIESLAGHGAADVMQAPGVSIKLSALHPRFDFAHWPESRSALIARVRELALAARASGIGLTLDAEEAARTEPLLDVFETVFADPALADWDGFGLAVQAYQKRARGILEWLAGLGSRIGRRIPLRLVKGAYWDAEIRLAQRKGLDGYPVFTRKAATDVSYLACAGYLHAHPEHFHAQYATHNAHTVAWLLTRYGDRT